MSCSGSDITSRPPGFSACVRTTLAINASRRLSRNGRSGARAVARMVLSFRSRPSVWSEVDPNDHPTGCSRGGPVPVPTSRARFPVRRCTAATCSLAGAANCRGTARRSLRFDRAPSQYREFSPSLPQPSAFQNTPAPSLIASRRPCGSGCCVPCWSGFVIHTIDMSDPSGPPPSADDPEPRSATDRPIDGP